MRIVLLGATGFVGQYLLPELSEAGHDCLALTRYRPGCRELGIIPRVEVRQQKSWEADSLAAVFEGADAVVNMVGILNESGRNGEGFRKAHVDLVEAVLAACHGAGVGRFLQVSALNAGKGSSHYLVSKGQAEEKIREATDIGSTIVQPSVIFGAGDSFFNRFHALLKFAPMLPLACPEARMQPVWAGDLVRMIRLALEDPETIGQTLIAVGPEEYSLRELVEFTARTAGLKRRIVGLPDGLARLQGFLMDFVPGKPFSSDNYRSLQTDNTSTENSLWRFGIQPRSIEAVVPCYLGGQDHQHHLDKYRQQVDR